jgi:hypothetical protein
MDGRNIVALRMLFAYGAQLILPRSNTTMSAAMPGLSCPRFSMPKNCAGVAAEHLRAPRPPLTYSAEGKAGTPFPSVTGSAL